MKIIQGIDLLKPLLEKESLALGTFDGFHPGHLKILETPTGVTPAVLTFTQPPKQFFLGDQFEGPLLTLEEKLAYLENLGVKKVFLVEFNEDFSQINSETFMEKILWEKIKPARIRVGFNFRFGHQQGGNPEDLVRFFTPKRVEVDICPPVTTGGKKGELVSSSLIRNKILSGEVHEAALLLGRYYHVSGQIIKGEGMGKNLGFPTANVTPKLKTIIPGAGVYACGALFKQKLYPAGVSIGSRPTFDREERGVECHIPNFSHNLYGENLTLIFIQKLREIEQFENPLELTRQINRDLIKIQSIYEKGDIQNLNKGKPPLWS